MTKMSIGRTLGRVVVSALLGFALAACGGDVAVDNASNEGGRLNPATAVPRADAAQGEGDHGGEDDHGSEEGGQGGVNSNPAVPGPGNPPTAVPGTEPAAGNPRPGLPGDTQLPPLPPQPGGSSGGARP